MGSSWLVLALLTSAAPLAEDPDFIRAKALYADLEFEGAMGELKKAAGRSYSEQERAELQVWMGLCSAQLRDELSVRAHFAQAVALDVDVALPGFAPPKVADFLEQARAEQRARLAAQAIDDPPVDETTRTDGGDGTPTDGSDGTPTDGSDGTPADGTPTDGSDGTPTDGSDGTPAEGDPATTSTSASPSEQTSVLPWVTAGALGAGAVVLVVVGTALATVGFVFAGLSTDPNQFQSDAQRYAQTAIGLYIGAGVSALLIVGLAAGAGATTVWAAAE